MIHDKAMLRDSEEIIGAGARQESLMHVSL